MSSNNTRQLILAYLQQRPRATARQLAIALQRTSTDIRYHISRLQRDGLVCTLPAKFLHDHRGRPARIFALSHQAVHQPHDHLLGGALSLLLHEPADKVNNLEALSNQIMPPEEPLSGRFLATISRLLERLNYLQYHARWEARTRGPCIIFENCPYRNLLIQFPQLCELDRHILQNNLHKPVKLEQHIHPEQPTPVDCRFTIQPSR